MSIYRKDYHYRIGTYIIRTMWGNRIKKYIYISKQNSEIVSGSVSIQNDYFSLPSNDTLVFIIGPWGAWLPDICLSKHSRISEI